VVEKVALSLILCSSSAVPEGAGRTSGRPEEGTTFVLVPKDFADEDDQASRAVETGPKRANVVELK